MPKATIIGGFGKMGLFFQTLLEKQGFTLTICDHIEQPTTHSYEADLERSIQGADLIILATPILNTIEVLEKIIPTISEKSVQPLVFDIASIKAPLIPSFEKIKQTTLRYTSTHPMFGPDAPPTKWRALLCPVSSEEAVLDVEKIFLRGGIKTRKVSLQNHDQYMNIFLSVPHLVNHIFARQLVDLDLDKNIKEKMAGTTFHAQIEIAAAVAYEDPELYYEILANNPQTQTTLDNLLKITNELKTIIKKQDREGFTQWMQTNAKFMFKMGIDPKRARTRLTQKKTP
ncbi:MAG: prephenate dehydrogenase/arogenate dehydrogenase family protein [Candidatus Ranarchaeia archaeon]|jgi:prephenate dehydrogenase